MSVLGVIITALNTLAFRLTLALRSLFDAGPRIHNADLRRTFNVCRVQNATASQWCHRSLVDNEDQLLARVCVNHRRETLAVEDGGVIFLAPVAGVRNRYANNPILFWRERRIVLRQHRGPFQTQTGEYVIVDNGNTASS